MLNCPWECAYSYPALCFIISEEPLKRGLNYDVASHNLDLLSYPDNQSPVKQRDFPFASITDPMSARASAILGTIQNNQESSFATLKGVHFCYSAGDMEQEVYMAFRSPLV